MSHTVTVVLDEIEGVNSAVYADLVFASTYATGGETLVPAAFGLNNIEWVTADVTSLTADAITAVFSRATGKLILVAPAGTQVANAADISAVTVSVRVLGN